MLVRAIEKRFKIYENFIHKFLIGFAIEKKIQQ